VWSILVVAISYWRITRSMMNNQFISLIFILSTIVAFLSWYDMKRYVYKINEYEDWHFFIYHPKTFIYYAKLTRDNNGKIGFSFWACLFSLTLAIISSIFLWF